MTKHIISILLVIISMILIIENFNTQVTIKFFGYKLIEINTAIIILISILIGFSLGISRYFISTKKIKEQEKENDENIQENKSG